jgi:hypothetical protein
MIISWILKFQVIWYSSCKVTDFVNSAILWWSVIKFVFYSCRCIWWLFVDWHYSPEVQCCQVDISVCMPKMLSYCWGIIFDTHVPSDVSFVILSEHSVMKISVAFVLMLHCGFIDRCMLSSHRVITNLSFNSFDLGELIPALQEL